MTGRDEVTKVERLKALLLTRATTGNTDPEDAKEYTNLRRELISIPQFRIAPPNYVKNCRSLDEFWDVIKHIETYASRRTKLREDFHPLLEALEQGSPPESRPAIIDLFRHQFPAGLPFGLTKPNVVCKAQGGKQVIEFEAAAGIGVIHAGVYPSLNFANLRTAITGQPLVASLDTRLLSLIQTPTEATFFREYARKYGMFLADIPVLVPQAWIQWHSLKKDDLRAAGSSYFDDLYRVDFVAFWQNRRSAILIDDISHYGVKDVNRWDASEMRYSSRLKEDRKLRKEGWDVFRISNWEIKNGGLPEILTDLKEFLRF